ncbi:hypothetical protein BLA29_004831 [Euroglyphus maynei]|uniref:Prenyltransferase alpha-alpha toroid domain-containing protein n=1 Tax=Euroglyphus maynei TaxID=6958 RepID=A0A1Y3BFF5_EURMA|nr:hypothetical protein BLA29_004831 [Euroglyphus maynei]
MLNSFHFINDQLHSEFLSSTFDNDNGGFGKYPDTSPDTLHTYFGIAALSLRVYNEIAKEIFVQSIYPALNISQRAYKHLCSIHSEWNNFMKKNFSFCHVVYEHNTEHFCCVSCVLRDLTTFFRLC